MLKGMRRLIWLVLVLGVGLWSVRTYLGIKHVLTFRPLVQEVLIEQGYPATEELILAMIYTESKGRELDLLQASESLTGGQGTIRDQRESLTQGIKVLAGHLTQAQQLGLDAWTAVQAYNFGPGYLDHVAQQGGHHTVSLSRAYSRDVVAPSLGNTTGQTYPYYHPVAFFYGGTSLYRNGGNSYYAKVVAFHQALIRVVTYLEA